MWRYGSECWPGLHTIFANGVFHMPDLQSWNTLARELRDVLSLASYKHYLTRMHTADFRLLANQWAECRLMMQWRHGCHAMRRSVCNAGASNGGRSLCVQISREWSYPLPIYWYHSKGNWLHYNFTADSFYIMKLFRRLRPLLSKLSKRRQI